MKFQIYFVENFCKETPCFIKEFNSVIEADMFCYLLDSEDSNYYYPVQID